VHVAGGGGAIEGLAATLMRTLGTGNGSVAAPEPPEKKEVEAATPAS
jgi:hypothetical protein